MARILICEDEHIVALDMQQQLEQGGHQVVGLVDSGEEAISLAQKGNIDLVLMDIHLRGQLDGIEAGSKIYHNHAIPIILLTAYNDEQTIKRAEKIQPFAYLIKPFEERELRTSIALALHRHNLELSLRSSEERYRSLFQNAPNAFVNTNAEGHINEYNRAFYQLLQASPQDNYKGRNILDIFENPSQARKVLLAAIEGRSLKGQELVLVCEGSKTLQAIVNASRLPAASSQDINWSIVDISQKRELEEQLHQAQKMEAMGRLAGGIAHDFNNIITAIMGYTNLLAEDLSGNQNAKEDIAGIQDASEKATNLTRQLLSFSRKKNFEPQILDANVIVLGIQNMLRRLVRENISISFNLIAEHANVSVDPGQFEQVLINLVVNAKDSIAESGSIYVETGNESLAMGHKAHFSQDSPMHKGYFTLSVSDTGSGIAKEDLSRVFEPFYTSKGLGKGTGMGLSIVYATIQRHGGYITIESEVDKGSRFTIHLPLAPSKSQQIAGIGFEEEQIQRGRGEILLVEDDDYLRSLLARILNKAGYRVHAASNPGEALIIAEREKDFILLSDIVMPRMNGFELADRLVTMHPDLKVLFMSGYYDVSSKQELDKRPWGRFIQKPFAQNQLLLALSSLLD